MRSEGNVLINVQGFRGSATNKMPFAVKQKAYLAKILKLNQEEVITMMFVTGDCHGDYRRFNTKNFPQQKEMTKDDYVIICGDFGHHHDNHRITAKDMLLYEKIVQIA